MLLGLGGGAVDSALNNYVALHYSSSAISFLHGFWGIGTTIGPILLGALIPLGYTWRSGYTALSLIQTSILVLSLIAFPLWNLKKQEERQSGEEEVSTISPIEALKRNGATFALFGFFAYCALENSLMVWNATYMVDRGLDKARSAYLSSYFFWGITIGRLLLGFITKKIKGENLIRLGSILLIIAIPLMRFMPLKFYAIVLLLLGLGAAPFYPMMLHQTPKLYGKDASAPLIGFQMASAYVGSTFIPPLFGLISKKLTLQFLPLYLLFFFAILIYCTEKKRILLKKKTSTQPSNID